MLSGDPEIASGKHGMELDNFAFVLLSEPQSPSAEAIVQAFRDFASSKEVLREEVVDSEDASSEEVIVLTLSTGEKSFVTLIPAAVPNGEADKAAEFSLSRFRSD